MATTKAVTTTPEEGGSLLPLSVDEIREVMEGALVTGERLDILNLPTIKVPAGGGKTWDLPDGSSAQELTGIIVVRRPVRAYWAVAFEGGGSPPDCSSLDMITGHGKPGGTCEHCPMAEWGSGKDNAQACRLITRLLVLQPDTILPALLPLPPSAFKACQNYVVGLAAQSKAPWHVRTAITLQQTKSGGGITYSVPEFRAIATLTKDQQAEMSRYREPWLALVGAAAVTEEV